ncbi:von Hippel-Lindau disease tumor suppressor-like isoform X2 [Lasioglossum baleicum]|uniref:von Hippel-Lindau disease tumor suppressor-like isoform X2 n=1 Tax=Lasioglossum baleicum TaxID=434251 RepID=UPI003FCED79D
MESNDGVEQEQIGELPTMVRHRRMRNFLQERHRRSRDAQKLLQDPQKGQVEHLRSLNNKEKSYVKFWNGTSRNVVLYWIDYEGQALSFGTLPSGLCVDMDTFVTHPWIFVDEETGDRFMVKQKDVYFPEPYGKSPRPGRTFVSITPPMYTLQELASRVIIGRLQHLHHIYQLEIPAVLKAELELKMKVASLRKWLDARLFE